MAAFDAETGRGSILQISYPDLAVRSLASNSDILTLAGVANGPSGVSWIENRDGQFEIKTAVADEIRPTMSLPGPLYYLQETARGFIGLDTDTSPASAVVVENVLGTVSYVPLIDTSGTIESVDVNATGRDFVLLVSDGPGTDFRFVVRASNRTVELRPPGKLIAEPFLDPRGENVYYEDHDRGVLARISVTSTTPSTVLEEDVSAADLSVRGVVAHTYVAPKKTNMVCFSQVAG